MTTTVMGEGTVLSTRVFNRRRPSGATAYCGDYSGQVIPGLYCGGESAGGCSHHGRGRAITQGYIAGKEAASERA